jgi:hypothetical protein
MNKPSQQFEYYSSLHNDFTEYYTVINRYIMELYSLPRKFIVETGPVLDRFLREHTIPGVPKSTDDSSMTVLQFISHLDDFTMDTIRLFTEHKTHVAACSDYLKKVTRLQASCGEDETEQYMLESINLTPELFNLHKGLIDIKAKADAMIMRLKKLEMKWDGIRIVIE